MIASCPVKRDFRCARCSSHVVCVDLPGFFSPELCTRCLVLLIMDHVDRKTPLDASPASPGFERPPLAAVIARLVRR